MEEKSGIGHWALGSRHKGRKRKQRDGTFNFKHKARANSNWSLWMFNTSIHSDIVPSAGLPVLNPSNATDWKRFKYPYLQGTFSLELLQGLSTG